MSSTQPMTTSPTSLDWMETIRQWWTPIVAVLGGVWGLLVAWRRLHRKELEEQRLQGKALRYLIDESRHVLKALLQSHIHDSALYDELVKQKVLIDGVRDEFWVHDGHASARETERVVEVLTRTQRIRAKTGKGE